MSAVRLSRTGAVAAALAQSAAGLTAHAVAEGCLPSVRSLALLVPTTVLAVLVVGLVVPRRPLLRLAAGQLAVHGVLALAACAGAAHVHAGSPSMVAAHVVALVASRAVLGSVVALAERAAEAVSRWVRPVREPAALVLPPAPLVLGTAVAAPRPPVVRLRAPRRGPPVRPRLLLPV